ncbi:hypothetical protein [Wolbachia endosymbiont of Diaphorina citri]|uniref:hypothetical protein n=1 Tax=Wolbachia endosymbiont of Diaphorina citri TaxID=116598 RepID=UPI0002FBD238|nr:hypothetical protein [Wolbachia endosymbiont of Diaphorina citri]
MWVIVRFKGGLDTYYNSGCSKEILKDYFFFDCFYPTAEPYCEVGNEMYELIKIRFLLNIFAVCGNYLRS